MSEAWGGRYVDHPRYEGGIESAAEPSEPDRRSVIRVVWATVAVLGVAAWALGFAAPAGALGAVRLDLAAAAVAAVGLLPAQRPRGWIVVALAVTGLGASLSALPAQAQWAVIATVVLDALQALVAVGAVLAEDPARRLRRPKTTTRDDEYARYLREYQAYVDYYGQPPPDQDPVVTAAGHATGVAVNHASADRDASAAIRAKYGSPQPSAAGGPAPRGADASAAGSDPGLPGTGRAGQRSDPGVGRAAPQDVRPTGH